MEGQSHYDLNKLSVLIFVGMKISYWMNSLNGDWLDVRVLAQNNYKKRKKRIHFVHVSILSIGCYLSGFCLLCLNSSSKFQDCNNEALFGISEKTLRLLEMGFSENEISDAFDRCGELNIQIGNIDFLSLLGCTRKTIMKVI